MNKGNALWQSKSRLVIWILLLFSCLYGAYSNNIFTGKAQIIKWDGYGYYLYLPAIFIHQDATKYDFTKSDLKNYPISNGLYQLQHLNDSTYFPTYPIGMSVLWYPFFQAAHFYCLIQDHYPTDGQSFPYQLTIFFSAIFYLGLGLFYLRKFLLHFASDSIVALVILVIFFGTNFYFYQLNAKELTHLYLFSLMSMYLYHWQRYSVTNHKKHLFFSSMIFALAVLIRNSELFWLLIPMTFQLNNAFVDIKEICIEKCKVILIHLVFALSLYFLIQMSYFKITTNFWWLNGYGDHAFNLLQPNVYNCLFGITKGWFVYTPLALLFFIGCYSIYKQERKWFFSVVIYSLCIIYLLICWSDWTYGTTFGFRPIVQSYAFFSLPLSLLFSQIAQWHIGLKSIFVVLVVSCCTLNIFQSWQYEQDIIDRNYQNWAYYKRAFLKTSFDAHDKIVLDIPEHEFKVFKDVETIFESNKALTLYPKGNMKFNEYENICNIPYASDLNEAKKIQTTLVLSYYYDHFGYWECPQLITDIRDTLSQESTYWRGLKIPFVMRNKQHDTVIFNQALNMKENESLSVLFHNNTADSIIVHYLKTAFAK